MTYAAINAKLSAMSAKLLKPQDYEAINQLEALEDIMEWLANKPGDTYADQGKSMADAAARICRYISDKAQRDYIAAMAASASCEGSLHYYTSLWKSLNRLDKANQGVLRGILGAEIDLTNILWMYRLKRYHRVSGASTYGHLIPIRYRLSHDATRRMADAATPKALLEEVERSPYAAAYALMMAKNPSQAVSAGPINRQTPEQALASVIDRRYQMAGRRHPKSLAPTLAYLRRKKLEIQRINAVLSIYG